MNGKVHNLDDQSEDFGFILEGKEYRMKYPNTEEIAEAEKLQEDSPEQLNWILSLITSVESETTPIKEVLERVNIKKSRRFTAMVLAEFGDEEN